MLQQIRKSLGSTIMFVLLALLIASFALWGAGGGFGQQGLVVATVGSQEITAVEVRDGFNAEMTRIREQFGAGITTDQALQFGVHRQVLDQLILNAALDEEAENLGLLGSDEEVRIWVRQMEYFQDLTGKFSPVTYEQVLSSRGWGAKEFEDRVRVDIARQQLVEGITETALVPAILQDTLYSYRKESRKAEIATIPSSAVANLSEPTEENLLAFYELSKTNYRSPEYRDIFFLILRPSDFARAGDFTDEELQSEYDRRFDEFVVPDRRVFQVAILRTQDLALELVERVKAGEGFAAVSAELTGLTTDELLGGPSSYLELTRDYNERAADAVFNTGVGDITEPLETLVSWQIFRVSEEIAGSEQPFEDVKAELSGTLAEGLGIDALYDAVGVVDDEIAAGASLEEIAEAVGIPAIHIPSVSPTGQIPDGSLITNIEVFPYLQEAFQRFIDDELEFPQSPTGEEFYMIRVNGITEPVERPYADVKDQVRQVWLQEESVKILGERARAALIAAENGESLQSIASRHGGVRFETASYVRDRVFTQQELSPGIASLMFSLKLGEVGIEQDSRGTGYVILKVLEITEQFPDELNFEYQSLLARLSVEMKNDIFSQFQTNLRRDLEITINEELLEGMFDPDFQQQPGLFSGQ
ncbi:MAG: SurA N-terminal domain-containing protein [Alphaproteobacteria bacterium]